MNASSDDLKTLRHSTSHVLAEAVLGLFPDAKLGIGPAIEDGFYYDFVLARPLTPEDLARIEERMKSLLTRPSRFDVRVVEPDEARRMFSDQPLKLELIRDILARHSDIDGNEVSAAEAPTLTVYTQGEFTDLCAGPHVAGTDEIPAEGLKLLNTSAAYWRGNSKNTSMQRIYGTVWPTKAQLDGYLHRLEEAKKRDHRTLGRQLQLFTTSEQVGSGLILWQPKGATVRYLAERFSMEAHRLNGYEFVYTPHIGKATLWETSGHLSFYKENMYRPIQIETDEYFLKPMNCPFHSQIYKSLPRSYKELPVRFAEFGTVYRYEYSGALHGLTRVRGFTQDDAHTFCTPEQVDNEIGHALRFSLYILQTFGLKDFTAYISTKPPGKAIGSDADWEMATAALERTVRAIGLNYRFDEGGGAFYGPKIDLKVNDGLGREWQLSTVQFDFNLPERFDLTYVGSDSAEHRPVMVHRALFGSVERFIGMLIEHYAGAFPFWLAPVQVAIVPITDELLPYARRVEERLKGAGLRVEVDARSERMQAKIRDAQLMKIPVVAVVGKREAEKDQVAIRDRETGDRGAMSVDAFLDWARDACAVGVPRSIGLDA